METTFEVDKRNKKHCPKCKSEFLSFEVSSMPRDMTLKIICDTCSYTFNAQRESDNHEFKKESQEFNS